MKTIEISKDSSDFSKLSKNQYHGWLAQISANQPVFSTILTS
jgi:hypothetical protein